MQSLAEALQQLPASRELQAVLSYIFPTYGRSWPWQLLEEAALPLWRSVFLPECTWLAEMQHKSQALWSLWMRSLPTYLQDSLVKFLPPHPG